MHDVMRWSGVVASPALRSAGLSYAEVRAGRRRGELVPAHRGVHVAATIAETHAGQARAALAAVPRGVLSGVGAARIHGIKIDRRLRWEITAQPAETTARSRAGLKVVHRPLLAEQIVTVQGLPATSVTFTTADLMRDLCPAEALWILDQALARGVRTAELSRHLVRGQRGVRQARYLLGHGDARSESALESAGRLVWIEAGVPMPVPQWVVRDAQGIFVARVDFAWPASCVIAELDGREGHERPEALLSDRRRQNALVTLGFTVLRFTWHDVLTQPWVLVEELAAALATAPAAAPYTARSGASRSMS